MKYRNKLITIVTGVLVAIAAYASQGKVQTPVYSENDAAITVTKAQPNFIIKLKSNPTTGYTWTVNSEDNQLVIVKKHQYLAPQKGLIGAGGFDEWQFSTNPALFNGKQVKLIFVYARNWENVEAAKKLEFTVTNK